MSIAQVIAVLNRMAADGVIDRYAVGGAVGATFYLEPVATVDLDVFVSFPEQSGRGLIDPRPVFDYLIARGAKAEGEYIVVAGWPVQLLPPTGALVEEALMEAVTVDVEGTPARVMSPEHLAAIALQTGRGKDHARLLQFVESAAIDSRRFRQILRRHGLTDRWRTFERRFLRGK